MLKRKKTTDRDILTALAAVTRAEIAGLRVEDGNVTFLIVVDPRDSDAMEPVRQQAEAAVRGLPGIKKATAILTAERPAGISQPISRTSAQPDLAPAPANSSRRPPSPLREMPAVRHIVAVASGKGGVGKSTVAVNLALALRRLGLSVGLMDADIYGPSVPRMLGLQGKKPALGGEKLTPLSTYGIKVMSMGFLVEEDAPMIWRGPMINAAVRQFLEDVDWSDSSVPGGKPLDVLIVDMPPGTGDAQLTLIQKVPLSGAVIVSTPQDIALIDARKGLAMFRQTNVPILGIVENMSYFCCPQCGGVSEIFGHGGARAEAEKLDVPFLGEIPLHPVIRALSDAGTPVVAERPDSHEAKAYIAMAQVIAEKALGRTGEQIPLPAA